MKPHFKRMRDQAIREAEAERVEAGACMLLYCLVGLSDTDIVGKSIGPALEAAGQLMRMRQYYSARQILHEVKKDLDRFLIHHPADEASDGI